MSDTDRNIDFLISQQLNRPIQISYGCAGEVYKCIDENSNEVAVKVFRKPNIPNKMRMILTELNFYREHFNDLDHLNILKFSKLSAETSPRYLILELCQKNLHEFVYETKDQIEESLCFEILADISRGLQFLHDRLIIHGDIKLENILLGFDGKFKICDFGYSTQLKNSEDKATELCGTYMYFSPEMTRGDPYDISIDVWALGVIFYELLFKREPFTDYGTRPTYRKIQKGKYDISSREISQKAQNLLSRMLDLNSQTRISISEVLDTLVT